MRGRKHQAEALRSAARARSNLKLDWENLAEEIEELGKVGAARAGEPALANHPAPRQSWPTRRQSTRGRGWRETIMRERLEIERILEGSPSLRREVPHSSSRRPAAIELAIDVLRAYGELKDSDRRTAAAAYTPDRILGDWFPPEPQG